MGRKMELESQGGGRSNNQQQVPQSKTLSEMVPPTSVSGVQSTNGE